MKILIRYIVLLVMFVGLNGCENPNQSAGNITEDKMQALGLEDALAARDPRLSQEDISSTVAEFEKEMKKKQEELQASQQKI